jgi:hypothetical protein
MVKNGPKISFIILMAFGEIFVTAYLAMYFEQIELINKYPKNLFIGVVGFLFVSVIFIYAWRSMSQSSIGGNKKIIKHGRPARAKIISMGEGGMGKNDRGIATINDQPVVRLELEVYDGDKSPYQASIKRIIPRLQVPQLQIGAMIAIKINPNNSQEIEIDPEGEGLKGFENRQDYNEAGSNLADSELIRKEGKDGEAEVLEVRDTGESKDMMPIVEITYQITGSSIEPYKLLSKVSMATEHIELIKSYIGQKIPAKIHPNNKNKVAMDFQSK